MKRITWISIFIAVIALAFWAGTEYVSQPTKSHAASVQKPIAIAPAGPSSEFLLMCSGKEPTAEQTKSAVEICAARVRGFADGHAMTMRIHEAKLNVKPLWCIDQNTTDSTVLATVLRWTDENPDKFWTIAKDANVPTATLMVVVAALHHKFPCEAK